MALHKLESGRGVIDDIVTLGRALAYEVRTEVPVEPRAGGPAVDVGWYRDSASRYPLLIFEIESTASNTMANNAVKVFSQPATDFEKPLFFFHVVGRAGRSTSRVEALQRQFGSHNYRLYVLDQDPGTRLLKDVLSQHRRVAQSVSVGAVLDVLGRASVLSPDLLSVLDHAWSLGFRGAYLEDLASAPAAQTTGHTDLFIALAERVRRERASSPDAGYSSYVGSRFFRPLHAAILARTGAINAEQAARDVAEWQERTSGPLAGCRQIGPYFGLSQEYDELVVTIAAPIWALIAGVAHGSPAVVDYAATQLGWLVSQFDSVRGRMAVYAAAWGMHLAASAARADVFETCRSLIHDRGGLRVSSLIELPGFLDVITENAWPELSNRCSAPLPPMAELRSLCEQRYRDHRPSGLMTGIRALTDDTYPADWGADLLALLAHGGA